VTSKESHEPDLLFVGDEMQLNRLFAAFERVFTENTLRAERSMLLFFEAFNFEQRTCQLLQRSYLLFAIRNFFLVNDKRLEK
jgi:hypothetical protein